jgi:4-hydroxysphinganine ceramide fatty acyl 2-hydroxylase
MGIASWTLAEYLFHRFLFHIDEYLPDNRVARLVHFAVHGIHHFMPMDRYRLVMPPLLMICLSLPVVLLGSLALSPEVLAAFAAGCYAGYILYDLLHYFLHHGNSSISYLKSMKHYHVLHHYADFNSRFGVTSQLWDVVFGSLPSKNKTH